MCINPTPNGDPYHPDIAVLEYDARTHCWELRINQRVAHVIWMALVTTGNPDHWTADTIEPDIRAQAACLAGTFEAIERGLGELRHMNAQRPPLRPPPAPSDDQAAAHAAGDTPAA